MDRMQGKLEEFRQEYNIHLHNLGGKDTKYTDQQLATTAIGFGILYLRKKRKERGDDA